MALLDVTGLEVRFDTPEGVVKAVNGMDLSVAAGETLAIVGESGSGKSQLVMALLGLLAENGSASGRALFRGQDLMQMTPRELNGIRGKHIAMIFQDPMTSLNPYLTIEKQMVEVAMHHQGLARDEARAHAVEMLRAVRIPDPEERIRQYPHEYSGGMRQRVMIAIGLLCEPDLLIADEPTTALDVTVQAQITELVGELRQQRQMAIILITHDMAAVAEISDRIIVMYAGEAVETGSVEDIFYRPHHPYTRGLLASVPRLDRVSDEELQAIPGNPPNLQDLPSGCRFRDRCSQAMEECLQRPPLWTTGGGRTSRCFLPMEGGYIAAAEGPNEPGEPVETAEVRDASAAGPGDERREGAA
jgi:oligopeptide transport system ATP-binding protein